LALTHESGHGGAGIIVWWVEPKQSTDVGQQVKEVRGGGGGKVERHQPGRSVGVSVGWGRK